MTNEEPENSEPDGSINLESAENTDADDIDITKMGVSVKDRREKISKFLKEKRDQKLNQKLAMETQMFSCAKEELDLKRKILDNIEAAGRELSQTLNKEGKVMETIGNSVSQSLGPSTDFFKHMTV